MWFAFKLVGAVQIGLLQHWYIGARNPNTTHDADGIIRNEYCLVCRMKIRGSV